MKFVACDMPEAYDLTVGIMALIAQLECKAMHYLAWREMAGVEPLESAGKAVRTLRLLLIHRTASLGQTETCSNLPGITLDFHSVGSS